MPGQGFGNIPLRFTRQVHEFLKAFQGMKLQKGGLLAPEGSWVTPGEAFKMLCCVLTACCKLFTARALDSSTSNKDIKRERMDILGHFPVNAALVVFRVGTRMRVGTVAAVGGMEMG